MLALAITGCAKRTFVHVQVCANPKYPRATWMQTCHACDQLIVIAKQRILFGCGLLAQKRAASGHAAIDTGAHSKPYFTDLSASQDMHSPGWTQQCHVLYKTISGNLRCDAWPTSLQQSRHGCDTGWATPSTKHHQNTLHMATKQALSILNGHCSVQASEISQGCNIRDGTAYSVLLHLPAAQASKQFQLLFQLNPAPHAARQISEATTAPAILAYDYSARIM
eukprot:1317766-Pleurochrysis_carterae.AAC.1